MKDLWKVLGVAVLGSLVPQLSTTIVGVSLPTLAVDLKTTVGTVQWVLSGYLLALALMLPLTGWLVDRIGVKRLYLLCSAVFTMTSALCGLAWDTGSLIGFRVLQGMAGGLLAPMAQMMVARVAGKQMARLMGFVSVPVLLGPMLGPVLAGLILQYSSWRWLFFLNIPLGVLALVLALVFLPDDNQELHPRSFDLKGFVLLSPAMVLLVYGADHVGEGWGLVLLAASFGLLGMFIVHGFAKGPEALVDVRLFKGPVLPFSAVIQFLVNGLTYSGQFLIPLYLITGCGLTPGTAGWLLAPAGLGMLCTVPFLGTLTERFGFRPVSSAGALVGLVTTIPFAFMAGGALSVPLAAAAIFLRGAGLGAVNIPSMAAAYGSIPKEALTSANTAINVVQRMGGPLVTTLVSIFFSMAFGYPATFWFLVGLHGLALACTLGLPKTLA